MKLTNLGDPDVATCKLKIFLRKKIKLQMGFMACNDRVPKIWPFDKFHPSVTLPFVKEILWALDVASK